MTFCHHLCIINENESFFGNKCHIHSQGPISSLCINFQLDWASFNFGGWGVGVVNGWVSYFFIVKFEFYVPKLVSVSIFSSIASLFKFGGVGHGRGQRLGFRFFNC